MSTTAPYRAFTARKREAFVPSFGWTRRATLVVMAVGALLPLRVVYDLLVDHDCANVPTPHYALAVFVLVGAVVSSALGVRSQRWAVRTIARRARVRSRWGSAAFASLSMCPSVLLAIVASIVAVLVDVEATFHLCFDIDIGNLFKMGC